MFGEDAIRVVMLCQEEAVRLGQTQEFGTAFLLLGLIAEGQGTAAQVLLKMGLDLETARREVEEIVGRRAPEFYTVNIPFSRNAAAVLEQSLEEAKRLGHPTIRTEHLLLAIASLKQGVAYQVLQNLQVDTEQLQSEILAAMSEAELSKYDFVPAPTQDLKDLAQDLDRLIEQMSETLTIAKSKSEILKRNIRSRSLSHSEAIDSIPKLPNSPEGIATKESLTELCTIIETEENFTDEDKEEILAQIQFLASLWIGRSNERVQKANRRSLRSLKGFIADLPDDAPQLPTYQRLLVTISNQFHL
ncbi:Clp protease N-terminal domain-containing protein [Leptolyngbya sp. AN03gr2]|uniref:Clp protease N-terminal domain-containing protein n=1 Tax=unclassified Leptolyngbya TaxID=2650499 RepID=UPI003D30F6B3